MPRKRSEPKSQSTPGPWTHVPIEASDDHRIVYCLIGPEAELSKRRSGVAYAGTYGKTRNLAGANIRLSDGECEANARLIAAAPEMLEALEALLKLHEAHHNCPEHAAARAVIAKVYGGAA